MALTSTTLGIVAGGAGILCLFTAWRRLVPLRRWVVVLGWSLLLASMIFWVGAAGAEFGVIFSLLAISLLGWGAVVINHEVRFRKRKEQSTGTVVWPRGHTVAQNIALFAIVVPLAAAASTLITVAFVRLLPWQALNQFVLALFLMPVVWGCAACWVCADRRMLRPTLVLVTGGALSALFLYV